MTTAVATAPKTGELVAFCQKLIQRSNGSNPNQLAPEELADAFSSHFSLEPPLTWGEVWRVLDNCNIHYVADDLPEGLRGLSVRTDDGWLMTCWRCRWTGGQVFTPLHEVRHIVSETLLELDPSFLPEPIGELFEQECERFAAAVFLPTEWFKSQVLRYRFDPVELHREIGCGYQVQLLRIREVFAFDVALVAAVYENQGQLFKERVEKWREMEEFRSAMRMKSKWLDLSPYRAEIESPDNYRMTMRVLTSSLYVDGFAKYYGPLFALNLDSPIAKDPVASIALKERADVYRIQWPMRPLQQNWNKDLDPIIDAFLVKHFGVISQVITIAIPRAHRKKFGLLREPWGVQKEW